MTTTFVHVAARGYSYQGAVDRHWTVTSDLHGLLGLDESVSPGYEQIRIKMDVKADCTDEQLDDLARLHPAALAGVQHVCRPVRVRVERAR